MINQKKYQIKTTILYSLFFGILLGLLISALVVFYITNTPNPFVDRVSRQENPVSPEEINSIEIKNRNYQKDNSFIEEKALFTQKIEDKKKLNEIIEDILKEKKENFKKTLDQEISNNSDKFFYSEQKKNKQEDSLLINKIDEIAYSETQLFLQFESFQKYSDAETMLANLALLGLPGSLKIIRVNVNNSADIYKVQIGPYLGNKDKNIKIAEDILQKKKIDYSIVYK